MSFVPKIISLRVDSISSIVDNLIFLINNKMIVKKYGKKVDTKKSLCENTFTLNPMVISN